MDQKSNYSEGKLWKLAKQQHILETAFRLFTEKGIELVTMPEIAQAAGVGRATIFRYFPTKLDLVIMVGTWKWNEFIKWYDGVLPREKIDQLSGAGFLRFYLDAFLDLYRNQPEFLRFNYNFNYYLRYETGNQDKLQLYMQIADKPGSIFHELYERGKKDGTLNTDIPETTMFSTVFHIMLAAVTRYAVGLVIVFEDEDEPENELLMLEEMMLARFTKS